MADLLKPLNKEKAGIMSELLENVQTPNLRSAYEKYLPAVLTGAPGAAATQQRRPLVESRSAVTGDRSKTVNAVQDTHDSNVVELKRLAGLK